jgi:hypothetical protein
VSWLYNLHIPTGSNWLLLGDFNFIRSSDNRNKPGGDVNDMFLFNEIIGHLGLLELPLRPRLVIEYLSVLWGVSWRVFGENIP